MTLPDYPGNTEMAIKNTEVETGHAIMRAFDTLRAEQTELRLAELREREDSLTGSELLELALLEDPSAKPFVDSIKAEMAELYGTTPA